MCVFPGNIIIYSVGQFHAGCAGGPGAGVCGGGEGVLKGGLAVI